MPLSTLACVSAPEDKEDERHMQNWLRRLRDLKRYPALLAGILIIAIFIGASIYTIIAIPYGEAVTLWRAGVGVWEETPQNASPVWFDVFTRDRMSRTIVINSANGGAKTEEALGQGMKRLEITLPFRYDYDRFPTDLRMFFDTTATGTSIPTDISWHTPDGRTFILKDDLPVRKASVYYITQDADLRTQLSGLLPHVGLFAELQDTGRPLKGDHELVLTAELPEDVGLDAKLVVYGQVYGVAGTDHRGRDLMIALLWGAPVGLMFGVIAAVGTTVLTFLLAATGTWMGGKVDRIFQWLTQVNLIIPLLPILVMIGYFYTRSIWAMLGLVIALNIFGATMLLYRSMFLQAKEAPFIEAAQAYGAGNARIIFRYLMPRIAPTLLPEFVLIIPTFVFLEATLAVLGLGDPVIPTWGKIMNDAVSQSALYKGYYYWLIEPALLLMLMGIGFSLIGYSLDRIFNPRLRTV